MLDFVHFFYLIKEHRYDDFVCISRLSPYKLVPVRAGSGARLASREREKIAVSSQTQVAAGGGSWRQAHLCLSLSHNLICILSLNLSLSQSYLNCMLLCHYYTMKTESQIKP